MLEEEEGQCGWKGVSKGVRGASTKCAGQGHAGPRNPRGDISDGSAAPGPRQGLVPTLHPTPTLPHPHALHAP